MKSVVHDPRMRHESKRGGRPRKGSVEPAGMWPSGSPLFRFRLRLGDGTKSQRYDVPEGLDLSEARKYVAGLQAQENANGGLLARKRIAARDAAASARAPHECETADAWFTRYLVTKRCGATYLRIAEVQWKKWIAPIIGHKAVRDLTRDDLEDVRDKLDRAVDDRKLRPATARSVWGHLTAAMKAAYAAKDRSLRVHLAPLHVGILPPQRGASRARQWLYPREWLAFITHEPTPLAFRRACALALFSGLRPSELAAVTLADIDREAGVIHVTKALEKRTKNSDPVVKPTKTEENRSVPIHPALRPLLEALDGEDSDPVVETDITHEKTAAWFRSALAAAGVTRTALFTSTETTEKVDFRSLRDTYATWGAIEGWPLQVIQRRLGHRTPTVTAKYCKAAEVVDVASIGPTFPPLPPEVWPSVRPTKQETPGKRRGFLVARVGFEGTMHASDSTGSPEVAGLPDPKSADGSRSSPEGERFGPAFGPTDDAETVLARALDRASAAGRFDVVAQLADELKARRLATSPNVVDLETARKRSR